MVLPIRHGRLTALLCSALLFSVWSAQQGRELCCMSQLSNTLFGRCLVLGGSGVQIRGGGGRGGGERMVRSSWTSWICTTCRYWTTVLSPYFVTLLSQNDCTPHGSIISLERVKRNNISLNHDRNGILKVLLHHDTLHGNFFLWQIMDTYARRGQIPPTHHPYWIQWGVQKYIGGASTNKLWRRIQEDMLRIIFNI